MKLTAMFTDMFLNNNHCYDALLTWTEVDEFRHWDLTETRNRNTSNIETEMWTEADLDIHSFNILCRTLRVAEMCQACISTSCNKINVYFLIKHATWVYGMSNDLCYMPYHLCDFELISTNCKMFNVESVIIFLLMWEKVLSLRIFFRSNNSPLSSYSRKHSNINLK